MPNHKEQVAWGDGTRAFMFLCLLAFSGTTYAQVKPEPGLGVEISIIGRGVMYLPISSKGEMIGIVPLENERFEGIRLTPELDHDHAKVEVALLLRNKGEQQLTNAEYSDLQRWPMVTVGNYQGKVGDVIETVESKKLNVPTLSLRITVGRLSPVRDNPQPFCTGGGMLAIPRVGICMGVGGIGMCCRAGSSSRRVETGAVHQVTRILARSPAILHIRNHLPLRSPVPFATQPGPA